MKLLSSPSSLLLHRRPSGAAGFLLCLLALSSAILESQSFRHGPSSSSFSTMTRTTSPIPLVQRHIGAHRRRADSLPLMGVTTAGLVAGAGAAAGLVAGARTAVVAATSSTSLGGAMGSMITCLRGGGGGAILETTVGSAVAASLASGPYGVLGLAAIASAIVTPLTVYRQAYAFTVAYGLSAAAMGWSLRTAFGVGGGPVGSLTAAMMAYGLRLSAHLLLRELTVPSKREQLVSFDKTPRLKRIPFALSVGLFYGFMASPALFLCRASAAAGGGGLSGTAATAARIGGALAWFGLIVEAWTDGQKLWSKRGRDGAMDFQGPSTWWYGVSRHPNYAAEILFWFSVLAAGLPSFFVGGGGLTPATGVGLVCSVLGVFGILQVMLGATKRLEGKQDEKYGGQLPFEEWKAKTGALAPPTSLKGLTGSILPGSISVGLTVLAVKLTSGV